MGYSVIPAPAAAASTSAPSPSFIPSAAVPAGLTLRNTYTVSTGSLTFPSAPDGWVYVVAVGGGGGGCVQNPAGGGGGGACVQGWLKAAELTSVTIGAGGATTANSVGNSGSATLAGRLRAPGGGGAQGQIANGLEVEPGAGTGGSQTGSTYSTSHVTALTNTNAFGLFVGGRTRGTSYAPLTATSGAGSCDVFAGGAGYGGPGGGGGRGVGGSSSSPNGTTYTGGSSATNVGGGGAGILANGSTGVASTAGGAGGSGGGGGGGATAGTGGAGGNGAVLVYY